MDTCDVIIAGGGPAGSTCAWALRRAGLDVVVIDRALFPRDKVCAGWITPQVVADLQLDVRQYQPHRTFQPFTRFLVGLIGRSGGVEASYEQPVSFGIRRTEFDEYLLRRSGARLRLGAPLSDIRRDGRSWTINESLSAPMLVGAGGHLCPVARRLNGPIDRGALVLAQEAEFPLGHDDGSLFAAEADRPELYFSRALDGYGWCVRKQDYMNIGFGHFGGRSLPNATAAFAAFLEAEGRIPARTQFRWKGHAYMVSSAARQRVVSDGVLLVGDAAGLAYPQSGEGIRPAIESGLMAASTIIGARHRYDKASLAPYEDRLHERFEMTRGRARSGYVDSAARLGRLVAPELLRVPWFVRRVLLNRWFLHAHEQALVP